MLLTRRSLPLLPSPPSVRTARTWVGQVLTEIGREDLAESAQLAVSEVVTNALIHARPPFAVRVLGTVAHPRIEVVDGSPVPPRRAPVVPEPEEIDEFNLTTFGRGLDLVSMVSRRWGADLGHDGRHKTVWFEPMAEINEDEHASPGEIFGFGSSPEISPVDDPSRMTMKLLGVPARLFGQLRRYHFELRRELRLLSLTAPGDYPLAVQVTEVFLQADRERRSSEGIAELDQSIAAGADTVDLTYRVPLSTPLTMARINALLDEVYDTYSDQFLLSIRPPQLLQDLQHWYFTEFVRQGRGEPPRSWSGPTSLPLPSTA